MRDVEHAPLHLLQQLPEVVVVEGESTNQEGVQDDPARPHVGASSVVLLALPKGGEMRRATAGARRDPVVTHSLGGNVDGKKKRSKCLY